ncbi:MAG: hypothetical protein L6R39_001490 [Caloplaca ligustica]|nr:MAG: hypothetical protein L6R39_001490 [Caloplaca ligustica]
MGPLPPRQKKVFKNARKRIGDLVKARVMSLAALGSGKDPKRTPLSEALDKWIELLRMKENARQQREAETMRANMTSMLGQSRNASDDEGSSSDTATSGSGSGTSRSQNRSIARKKKARIDHEAKPQAPFDRDEADQSAAGATELSAVNDLRPVARNAGPKIFLKILLDRE